MICPFCGGHVYENVAGDLVCEGCGETLYRGEVEAVVS
jgi:hypothetical protein